MRHAAVFPRGGMELKPAREEAYGDPIPQNVNFLDQKSKFHFSLPPPALRIFILRTSPRLLYLPLRFLLSAILFPNEIYFFLSAISYSLRG